MSTEILGKIDGDYQPSGYWSQSFRNFSYYSFLAQIHGPVALRLEHKIYHWLHLKLTCRMICSQAALRDVTGNFELDDLFSIACRRLIILLNGNPLSITTSW